MLTRRELLQNGLLASAGLLVKPRRSVTPTRHRRHPSLDRQLAWPITRPPAPDTENLRPNFIPSSLNLLHHLGRAFRIAVGCEPRRNWLGIGLRQTSPRRIWSSK